MARLVYLDETGSVGRGAKKQPRLIVAAVVVDELQVRPLADAAAEIARQHLGVEPVDFELHGHEIWQGVGPWADKTPVELIDAYESAIDLLEAHEIDVSFASIHKKRLHDRHAGKMDSNAYLLAVQFVLEKVDAGHSGLKVVIAEENKEQKLRAVNMVSGMQKWGVGEVSGHPLKTVIDSLHFVSSSASPGVQMADLIAYVVQRKAEQTDIHPNAQEAIARLHDKVMARTKTWRAVWQGPGKIRVSSV